jgi:hypothetical protein
MADTDSRDRVTRFRQNARAARNLDAARYEQDQAAQPHFAQVAGVEFFPPAAAPPDDMAQNGDPIAIGDVADINFPPDERPDAAAVFGQGAYFAREADEDWYAWLLEHEEVVDIQVDGTVGADAPRSPQLALRGLFQARNVDGDTQKAILQYLQALLDFVGAENPLPKSLYLLNKVRTRPAFRFSTIAPDLLLPD